MKAVLRTGNLERDGRRSGQRLPRVLKSRGHRALKSASNFRFYWWSWRESLASFARAARQSLAANPRPPVEPVIRALLMSAINLAEDIVMRIARSARVHKMLILLALAGGVFFLTAASSQAQSKRDLERLRVHFRPVIESMKSHGQLTQDFDVEKIIQRIGADSALRKPSEAINQFGTAEHNGGSRCYDRLNRRESRGPSDGHECDGSSDNMCRAALHRSPLRRGRRPHSVVALLVGVEFRRAPRRVAREIHQWQREQRRQDGRLLRSRCSRRLVQFLTLGCFD
jgi:hypothetical protein